MRLTEKIEKRDPTTTWQPESHHSVHLSRSNGYNIHLRYQIPYSCHSNVTLGQHAASITSPKEKQCTKKRIMQREMFPKGNELMQWIHGIPIANLNTSFLFWIRPVTNLLISFKMQN